MGWPRIEVAVRTVEDELARLESVVAETLTPAGRSPRRERMRAAIATLRWLRSGGPPPSETLLNG